MVLKNQIEYCRCAVAISGFKNVNTDDRLGGHPDIKKGRAVLDPAFNLDDLIFL